MTPPTRHPPDDAPTDAGPLEELLRRLTPQALGQLVARFGDFSACEDAVQEALLAASVQWRDDGVPEHPRGWLVAVAFRRLADTWRADASRHRREAAAISMNGRDLLHAPAADEPPDDRDDTLDLLFLCCAPSLTTESQVAVILRAVGGLTTRHIAAGFLVPEATMTRRISRAKQRLAGAFSPLTAAARGERLPAVLHALYLIFNEGYTATSGADLHRVELTTEALRLTRIIHHILPTNGEVAGLLALMLLTDARRPARTTTDGALIPLAEQDRTRWKTSQIAEGVALLEQALPRSLIGPYQVQAAIAAVHADATRVQDTDWEQIEALYRLLERLAPGPVVAVNHAVAVAMSTGPAAALRLLNTASRDPRYRQNHRLSATRAHLLDMAGHPGAACTWYETAARQTTSLPEQRYLHNQAARLSVSRPTSSGQ